MGLAEPSEIAAGKLQAVSAVGHAENGTEFQCPKKSRKAFHTCSKGRWSGSLTKGLVGTKCTAQLCIDGIQVNCLLDTGSVLIPQGVFSRSSSEAVRCLVGGRGG